MGRSVIFSYPQTLGTVSMTTNYDAPHQSD